jgi:hypothetical protein
VILAGGMTVDELQRLIHISPGPGFSRYWIDPKLIGPDGRANPQYLQVPTQPGQFGQFVYLYGQNSLTVDATVSKTVPLSRAATFTLWLGVFNVLNNPIWGTPGFAAQTSIDSTTFGQSTQPANNTNARTVLLRGDIRF